MEDEMSKAVNQVAKEMAKLNLDSKQTKQTKTTKKDKRVSKSTQTDFSDSD